MTHYLGRAVFRLRPVRILLKNRKDTCKTGTDDVCYGYPDSFRDLFAYSGPAGWARCIGGVRMSQKRFNAGNGVFPLETVVSHGERAVRVSSDHQRSGLIFIGCA